MGFSLSLKYLETSSRELLVRVRSSVERSGPEVGMGKPSAYVCGVPTLERSEREQFIVNGILETREALRDRYWKNLRRGQKEFSKAKRM